MRATLTTGTAAYIGSRAAGWRDRFLSLPGRGVEANVGRRELWAGGPRLAAERIGTVPAEIEEMQASGRTALVLGEGERPLAVFGLADQLRPEAQLAVAELAEAGVRQVVMLTGDSQPIASAVAERTEITEWHAGLLPAEKLQAINELRSSGAVVAMVGDGVNDAPALAAAQVGVAMGAIGSDIAIAAADVALMSDRLDRLPATIARGRRALGVMRANVIASLAIKGVLVLLAPFGLVTLVVAVAADMGMSLAVTLNAMRLLRRNPTRDSHRLEALAHRATST